MIKVTYYMYSCDTYYKIREMMEMDGLDSAKCQKSRKGDISGIFEMLMIIRRKMNGVHLLHLRPKRAVAGQNMQEVRFCDF